MTIDSHHHVWRYTPEEFAWIDDDLSTLRRDFGMDEYSQVLRDAGIDGSIVIEARQTVEETAWLLQLSDEYPLIKGVIGWVPLAADDVARVLDEFCAHAKFKGARHVVQAEEDGFLQGENFNRGICELTKRGLVYDILIVEHQLPQAIEFVDRHPEQKFVLDHIAKPRIKDRVLEPWRSRLFDLAQRENVVCKISGFVTEADLQSWSVQDLQPYWEAALEAFGPQRLMFGSDWPVCLAASEYSQWLQIVRNWAAVLSASEQAALFGGTALRVYEPEATVSRRRYNFQCNSFALRLRFFLSRILHGKHQT